MVQKRDGDLPPLVLIHGMWCPPEVWGNFLPVFEQAGYEVHVPALPLHKWNPLAGNSLKVNSLRENPLRGTPHGAAPEGIGALSMVDYVDCIEKLIGGLGRKPVLVGHSLGGLVALMTVSRGLARAAVLLTPAPAAGIFILKPSAAGVFLRTLLTPGFFNQGVFPSFREMSLVLNRVDKAQARELYKNVVWESGRVIFEVVAWPFDRHKVTRILYRDIDTPLLIIGAGKDALTPPKAIKKMADQLAHTATFEVFEDNGHWVLGEKGWEKIAARCLSWINAQSAGSGS